MSSSAGDITMRDDEEVAAMCANLFLDKMQAFEGVLDFWVPQAFSCCSLRVKRIQPCPCVATTPTTTHPLDQREVALLKDLYARRVVDVEILCDLPSKHHLLAYTANAVVVTGTSQICPVCLSPAFIDLVSPGAFHRRVVRVVDPLAQPASIDFEDVVRRIADWRPL